MHGVYAPKITNAGVGKLKGTSKNLATSPNLCFSPLAALNKMGNSGAITCACRLGVENFESHIHSSRVNQHLPKLKLLPFSNPTQLLNHYIDFYTMLLGKLCVAHVCAPLMSRV